MRATFASASSDATFVPGFIGIGLVPDAGGTWFIHRLLGFARAFEWMVSNRRLSASEALEWGLVSEEVPADGLEARVAELAAWYAALPTRGVAMTKQLFEHAYTASLDEQLELEAELQQAATQTEDFAEGVQAFLEKRAAELQGPLAPSMEIRTVDYHTAGEPFRIVTDGVEPPRGATILDKRRDALERLDHVRRLLVHEPRGHADMYGCFVVEPNDDGADLGVVFFHNAGYSTACGHGTIALVTWALDEGIVERREGENHVVVDVPSGRLDTWAQVEDGRVRSVRFRNVPSFVWAEGVELGDRTVDVAFGGAFYASVEERVEPSELPRLIELGRELKREVEAVAGRRAPARAGAARRLRRDLLAGGGRGPADAAQRHGLRRRRGRPLAVRQRHVGAARAPRPRRDGFPRGEELRHRSIVDTEFRARVVGDAEVAGIPAVITEVEGSAYRTGEHAFTLDPADPLGDGFLLR